MASQNLYKLFRNNGKFSFIWIFTFRSLSGCRSHQIRPNQNLKMRIPRKETENLWSQSLYLSLLLSEWLLPCSQPRCNPLWKVSFADHAIQHQYHQRGHQQQTEHSAMNAETPHLMGVVFGRQLLPWISGEGVALFRGIDVVGWGPVLGSRRMAWWGRGSIPLARW